MYLVSSFQFHKGTIRTESRADVEHLLRYFNSIKVRLEPLRVPVNRLPVCSFQFHKGTIRTAELAVMHLARDISIP